MRLLVTGGCGFIGSAVVRRALEDGHEVINLDALTYAANPDNLKSHAGSNRYHFIEGDICDADLVTRALTDMRPEAIIHLAAESHVDRSIGAPGLFVETNVNGTVCLLNAALTYFRTLSGKGSERFVFHHVSTDEVYGSLGRDGEFVEDSPYRPNSPYAASKAASDMMVRAWGTTYGLPVVISNCSNNYGPFQFPEKLIPVVVLSALAGRSIPVYGQGDNVRDWLFVDDHADALFRVLEQGRRGETYNIGGDAELTNIELVRRICRILDTLNPGTEPYETLITYVEDRPGHDFRYAINAEKIKRELDWAPRVTAAEGLEVTVRWYLDNLDWCRSALARVSQTGAIERLGLVADDAP